MMQSRDSNMPVGGAKKAAMVLLFVTAGAISVSGAFFCVYSLVNGISILVLGAQIPGVLFGTAVLYLGIRYFMKLLPLKQEVYRSTSRFSWANFRGLRKK